MAESLFESNLRQPSTAKELGERARILFLQREKSKNIIFQRK